MHSRIFVLVAALAGVASFIDWPAPLAVSVRTPLQANTTLRENGPKRAYGRPVDVLSLGTDAFLLTDDYAGVVYYIYKR